MRRTKFHNYFSKKNKKKASYIYIVERGVIQAKYVKEKLNLKNKWD